MKTSMLFFFLIFLIFHFPVDVLTGEELSDYDALLAGYIQNDSERIKLDIERERTALDLQRFSIENGINFTISSGSTVFAFSPSGTSVSAKPGIEANFPRARNTGISLDVPLEGSVGGLSRYGIDLSLKTGIISGRGDSLAAELELKRRNFLEALRNLEYRKLRAEAEFCEALKHILSLRNTMLDAQGEVLKARYDLEAKVAGGYGRESVLLRTSELKLRSRTREYDQAARDLETALEDFAADCGVPRAGIPGALPAEELLSISSFDPLLFAELESALWVQRVNSLSRKADDRIVSLDGSAGYSWRNADSSGGSGSASDARGSSLNAGLDLSAGGTSLSAGVSVPLAKPNEPSLTLSFQLKPMGMRISRLDRSLRALSAEKEAIAVLDAEKKYRDLLVEYDRKRNDLEWQLESYEEELQLYRLNAEEMKGWYERGIVKETDFLDAQTEYQSVQNRLLSLNIDRRIYNIEIYTLFIPGDDFRVEQKK